jgi:hypothetical protein
MTDPWCWYINANIKGVFVDGIHDTPYIAAPWILWVIELGFIFYNPFSICIDLFILVVAVAGISPFGGFFFVVSASRFGRISVEKARCPEEATQCQNLVPSLERMAVPQVDLWISMKP